MTIRAALLGIIIGALLLVLLAPTTVVMVTGRPLVVDCASNVDPAECDDARDGGQHGFPPITWYTIESPCTRTWGYWWPGIDLFSMTAYGLCEVSHREAQESAAA